MNKVTMRPLICIGWLAIAVSACSGLVAAPDEGLDNPTVVAVCSSAAHWKNGDKASNLMNPGQACNACHDKAMNAPNYAMAGTVYPTLREPDDCNGVNGVSPTMNAMDGVKIVVTDGLGRVQPPILVNSVGNFHYPIAIVPPYRVKVVFNDKENAMKDPVMSGDCNSCHTQMGTNGAPGRITIPQ